MKSTKKMDKTDLCLTGELTVKNAAILREDLLQSLLNNNCIELDLDAVTAVDLSCLQLICSAHRTARIEGKTLTLKQPYPPVFQKARKDAGFIFQQPCRFFPLGDCPWTGGCDT